MAYRGRVRGVLSKNITLSGLGQSDYGIVVGETKADEYWLLVGQTDIKQNGMWLVSYADGTWARMVTPIFLFGDWLRIEAGNNKTKGSVWCYSGVDNPNYGVDDVIFKMRYPGRALEAGPGLMEDFKSSKTWRLEKQLDAQGEYDFPSPIVTNRGVVDAVEPMPGISSFIAGLEGDIISGAPSDSRSVGAVWVPSKNGAIWVWGASDAAGTVGSMIYWYTTASYTPYGEDLPVTDEKQEHYDPGVMVRSDANGGRRYRFVFAAYQLSAFLSADQFHDPQSGFIHYLTDLSVSPWHVVDAAANTTNATKNLGPTGLKIVPPGTKFVLARVRCAANPAMWIDNSECGTDPSAGTGLMRVPGNTDFEAIIPLDSNHSFRHANASTGGNSHIYILGYWLRR